MSFSGEKTKKIYGAVFGAALHLKRFYQCLPALCISRNAIFYNGKEETHGLYKCTLSSSNVIINAITDSFTFISTLYEEWLKKLF